MVVVEVALGAVVLVVVVADVVDVDEDVEVVVVVVVAGVAGLLSRLLSVVPVSDPPKIVERGFPEISSMAVMNSRASTNTIAAVTAMVLQEKRRTPGRPVVVRIGAVLACRRSVAGASATAEISRRLVSPTGAATDSICTVSGLPPSSGADRPTVCIGAVAADPVVAPLAPVPPSLRNNVEDSGARTTTCLTASWPLSIDCATRAVAMVAAAEPIATPTMVPLTPKVEAITAAITAPAAEARIWRNENFTPGLSSRPRAARQRGR